MQLTLWTYEGPPHVGAMRVATGLTDVHYVLHAPQGDTYADLLFTMIERRGQRPPVTYTTFQARDLGGDTAELFKTAVREAHERFQPGALLVGSSCTAELIQDDPGGLAAALNLPIPVVPLELPSYQRKENWGASETFYQLARHLVQPRSTPKVAGARPRCNLLGPTALGFRHRDDVTEITRLLAGLGIDVAVTAPMGASAADIARLTDADFNVVLYPETALATAQWLDRQHGMPHTRTVPIGLGATRDFVAEVCALAGLPVPTQAPARARWYSQSVDSTYLTGKRVFIFGDATHALAAARIAHEEMGFEVVGLGTYAREFAREVREAAARLGLTALITDDYLAVQAQIEALQPELILGTQMERHIAKRLGLPCAVISAPVHVQDFPARYAPQMGPEGANVMFDTWVHPLMMGLEEHLIGMFREDFEFHAGAAPSHLGGHSGQAARAEAGQALTTSPAQTFTTDRASATESPNSVMASATDNLNTVMASEARPSQGSPRPFGARDDGQVGTSQPAALTQARLSPGQLPPWSPDAERELGKIPFFVRGKARRNTERFACERGLSAITLETLYDAKAHFSR